MLKNKPGTIEDIQYYQYIQYLSKRFLLSNILPLNKKRLKKKKLKIQKQILINIKN